MTLEHRELWFRAKRYGWGWTPSTWQGWLVIGVYFALAATGVAMVAHQMLTLQAHFAYIAILTLALTGLCWLKGEKPHWRWGGK